MSIRNYNAFIKGVRARHGLSLAEARVAYRTTSERLNRPAKGVDVTRRPVIVKQEAKRAIGEPARAKAREQKRVERIIAKVKRETAKKTPAKRAPGKRAPAKPPPPIEAPAAPRVFKSLEAYLSWFEAVEEDDYEYEEAEGTADYFT